MYIIRVFKGPGLKGEMQLAIIIPTYNERANIARLLRRLANAYPQARIYVIDDNSPDGTAKIVSKFTNRNKRVQLVSRPRKLGLASAYLDGFKLLLGEPSISHVLTMDADFSHDPAAIGHLMAAAKDYDLVIG